MKELSRKEGQESTSNSYLYSGINSGLKTFSISSDIVLRSSQDFRATIQNKGVVFVHEIVVPAKCFVSIMERRFFNPSTPPKRRDVNSGSFQVTAVLYE